MKAESPVVTNESLFFTAIGGAFTLLQPVLTEGELVDMRTFVEENGYVGTLASFRTNVAPFASLVEARDVATIISAGKAFYPRLPAIVEALKREEVDRLLALAVFLLHLGEITK